MSQYLEQLPNGISEQNPAEVQQLITDLRTQKNVLKCVMGGAVCCYLIGILMMLILLFSGRPTTNCGGSGEIKCFSSGEWKFLKFMAIIMLMALVVKLVIVGKLYSAVQNYETDSIQLLLKVIVCLWILGTFVNIFHYWGQWKTLLIDLIVGSLVNGLFVWYTHSYAKIILQLREHGKEPAEYDNF